MEIPETQNPKRLPETPSHFDIEIFTNISQYSCQTAVCAGRTGGTPTLQRKAGKREQERQLVKTEYCAQKAHDTAEHSTQDKKPLRSVNCKATCTSTVSRTLTGHDAVVQIPGG